MNDSNPFENTNSSEDQPTTGLPWGSTRSTHQIEFSSLPFARAFKAARLVTSKDEQRPALTGIHCEMFTDGARLVATDSYALIAIWVPYHDAEHQTQDGFIQVEEPDLNELPQWTLTLLDPENVLGKVCAHVITDAGHLLKNHMQPPPLTLNIGPAPSTGQDTFDGLDGTCATLNYGRIMHGTAATYEGTWPEWRRLLTGLTTEKTDAITVSIDIQKRLLGAVELLGNNIRYDFAGRNKALRFTIDAVESTDEHPLAQQAKSRPGCIGLIMPVRMQEELLNTVDTLTAEHVQDQMDEDHEPWNDPYLTEARRLVIETQLGSSSMLQRRLRIGYARAQAILNELEQQGVVGPTNSTKAREVLIDPLDIDPKAEGE